MFVLTYFIFALMTTGAIDNTYRSCLSIYDGAFSLNVGKLFSELKLVTDNLSLHVNVV